MNVDDNKYCRYSVKHNPINQSIDDKIKWLSFKNSFEQYFALQKSKNDILSMSLLFVFTITGHMVFQSKYPEGCF